MARAISRPIRPRARLATMSKDEGGEWRVDPEKKFFQDETVDFSRKHEHEFTADGMRGVILTGQSSDIDENRRVGIFPVFYENGEKGYYITFRKDDVTETVLLSYEAGNVLLALLTRAVSNVPNSEEVTISVSWETIRCWGHGIEHLIEHGVRTPEEETREFLDGLKRGDHLNEDFLRNAAPPLEEETDK